MRSRLGAVALALPGIAWLALFFLVPLGIILIVSLGEADRFGRIQLEAPGLDNYVAALDPMFLPTVWNSFRYALATTVLCLVIGYPVAYWISRYGGRHKTLLLVLVMLPFWTSYLIRTYAWITILGDVGVLNSLLLEVGIIEESIVIVNTDPAVIIGMTYGFLPFAILPLFVSIDRLDDSLVAAARDLYASGAAAFRHVTLPLTMPGIVAASILTFIPAIGDFVTPDILGGAETTTIARLVYDQFLGARNWPAGAALGMLLMVVTIILSLSVIRSLRREVLG